MREATFTAAIIARDPPMVSVEPGVAVTSAPAIIESPRSSSGRAHLEPAEDTLPGHRDRDVHGRVDAVEEREAIGHDGKLLPARGIELAQPRLHPREPPIEPQLELEHAVGLLVPKYN